MRLELLDRERWVQLHEAWRDREIFAHPTYVELFAGPNDRVVGAYASTPEGWILYPFILRKVNETLNDITTAYGYGGPFFFGDATSYADDFWNAFSQWAQSEHVVSEFVRFSLFEDQLLPYPGQREQRLINVVRSLSPSEEEIWADYEHKVRKNVNKARRSGVTIEIDTTGARIEDFLRIYVSTMERRDAERGYYFSRTFFETISQLKGQFVFAHAIHESRVVSTELALVSAHNVYSYLGGTDDKSFDLRPNDLLKHELFLWSKREGKQRFVMGGGYTHDDGIFRYKKAFAPSGLMPFYTGARVLDPCHYDELVAARTREAHTADPNWQPPEHFFPAYRAKLPQP
jgi:hypothetical protein